VPPAGGEHSDLSHLLPLPFTDDLSFGVLDAVCSITKINCLKNDNNHESITFSCLASSYANFFSNSSAFALARSLSFVTSSRPFVCCSTRPSRSATARQYAVVLDADAPDAAPPAPPSLFGYGNGNLVPPVAARSSATPCNILFNASGFELAWPFPLLGLTGNLSLPLSLFLIVFELFLIKKMGRCQFDILMGQMLMYTETVGGI
jgi:hypothetical protein